jgi:hypothetical protein
MLLKPLTATNRAGGNINVYGSPKDRNTKNVIGDKIKFKIKVIALIFLFLIEIT